MKVVVVHDVYQLVPHEKSQCLIFLVSILIYSIVMQYNFPVKGVIKIRLQFS